jgi:hypothetical protein
VAPPPPAPSGGDPAGYLGFVYPQTASGGNYPQGVEHLGDGLVGSGDAFGWAHVRHDAQQMLWFQRFLDPVGAGRRVQVVDAVDAGPVEDGYDLLIGWCRYGSGKTDPEIAAMTRFAGEADGERKADGEADAAHAEGDGPPVSSDIRAAWKLNRRSGRIEPVELSGLICQSPGD